MAGGMPLAFTQEDFLVFNEVSRFKFYKGTHGLDVRVPKNCLNHLVNSKESIGPLNGDTLMVVKSFTPVCARIKIPNKKVLLCERKRHTGCHVASTPSVVQMGGTPSQVQVQTGSTPSLAGGYPQGVPPARPGWGTPHLDLVRGYPIPGQGTPPPRLVGGTPHPRLDGVTPPPPPIQCWMGVPLC